MGVVSTNVHETDLNVGGRKNKENMTKLLYDANIDYQAFQVGISLVIASESLYCSSFEKITIAAVTI